MPSPWFLLAFVMFSLSGVTYALDKKDKAPKPEVYTSEAGRFTVTVAGKVTTDNKQIAYGANPEQSVNRTTSKWDALPSGTYSVTHADYPDTFKGLDDKLLDGARDGIKGPDGLGGIVQSEKPVEVAGPDDTKAAGREVVVKAKRNWVRVRLVVVELRLYQVMVTGTEEGVTSDAAKQFLDSFHLTK